MISTMYIHTSPPFVIICEQPFFGFKRTTKKTKKQKKQKNKKKNKKNRCLVCLTLEKKIFAAWKSFGCFPFRGKGIDGKGDRIGQIFACWVNVHFGSFSKITGLCSPKCLATFFHSAYKLSIDCDKAIFGLHFGQLFTNSSGHPVGGGGSEEIFFRVRDCKKYVIEARSLSSSTFSRLQPISIPEPLRRTEAAP
jgi:hypothetical protein